MVKIHVWLPDAEGHIGHTSLSVKDEYISFWPDGEATKKDLKIKRSQPGSLVESLREDILDEGNRLPETIELPTLNETAILDYLRELQRNTPRYQLARNNCSHVIADAMMAGAGCKPSFTPNAGSYGPAANLGKLATKLGNGIWTPEEIRRFGMELVAKRRA